MIEVKNPRTREAYLAAADLLTAYRAAAGIDRNAVPAHLREAERALELTLEALDGAEVHLHDSLVGAVKAAEREARLTARAEKAEAERDAAIARAEKEREGWARELAAAERRGMCLAECLAERDAARAEVWRQHALTLAAVGTVAVLRDALQRAHSCATLRDDGTCDGCFVSEALARHTLSGADELARLRRVEAAARARCNDDPCCEIGEVCLKDLRTALAEGVKGGDGR